MMTHIYNSEKNDIHTITVKVDRINQMASVYLNEDHIMTGNFWDFKPGTHGIDQFGNFKGHIELSSKIYQWLIKTWKVNFRNIKTVRVNYKYLQETN